MNLSEAMHRTCWLAVLAAVCAIGSANAQAQRWAVATMTICTEGKCLTASTNEDQETFREANLSEVLSTSYITKRGCEESFKLHFVHNQEMLSEANVLILGGVDITNLSASVTCRPSPPIMGSGWIRGDSWLTLRITGLRMNQCRLVQRLMKEIVTTFLNRYPDSQIHQRCEGLLRKRWVMLATYDERLLAQHYQIEVGVFSHKDECESNKDALAALKELLTLHAPEIAEITKITAVTKCSPGPKARSRPETRGSGKRPPWQAVSVEVRVPGWGTVKSSGEELYAKLAAQEG